MMDGQQGEPLWAARWSMKKREKIRPTHACRL